MRISLFSLLFCLLLCNQALAASTLDRLNGAWQCDGKALVQSNSHIRETLGRGMQKDMEKQLGRPLSTAEIHSFLARKFSETGLTFTISRSECAIKDDGKLSKVRFKVLEEKPDEVTLEMDGEAVSFTFTGPNAMSMKPRKAAAGQSMPFVRK